MKKNVIALLLAVVLASGSIGTVPAAAAEVNAQESEPGQEEADATAEEAEVTAIAEDEAEGESAQIAEEVPGQEEEETAERTEETEDAEEQDTEEQDTEDEDAVTAEEAAIEEDVTTGEEAFEEQDPEAVDETAVQEPETNTEKDSAKAEENNPQIINQVIEFRIEGQAVRPEDNSGKTPDDFFADYVDRSFNGQSSTAMRRRAKSASSSLTGIDRAIYDHIASYLPAIAAGEHASTVFEIPVDELGMEQTLWTAEELGMDSIFALDGNGDVIVDESGNASVSEEAIEAVSNKTSYDLSKVISALMADYPYQLYWFDKTQDTDDSGFAGAVYFDEAAQDYKIGVEGSITFSFPVAEAYSAGEYSVDTAIGQSVQTSVENANAIVSKYSSATDYDKLCGYRDEICSLVSYNDEAAEGGENYGNPWQMIWVFDGDPGTNVVCEGYAKAFKYLCDQTDFSGDVSCITVTGTMAGGTGEGPHMWNIVKMENGKNYLVDITNCDEEAVGAPDLLFLAGYSSLNGTDSYIITTENGSVTYTYDQEALSIYSDDSLALSENNWAICKTHVWNEDYTTDKEATCTEEGSESIHCSVCDAIDETTVRAIPKKEHAYGDWTVTKEATCTEAGSREKVCADCGDTITEEISAKGHVWEEEYTVDKEATCTEEGSESIHCSICGEIDESTVRAIPKKEHAYCDWTVTKEATCTEAGSKEKVCADCGDTITEEVSAKGHVWEEEYTVDKKPTATEEGSESIHCSVCGEIKESTVRPIPVLMLGWIEDENGWKYLKSDGTYPKSKFEVIDDKTYYFNESEYRVTGLQTINSKKYYFTDDGVMQTGWQTINGEKYYFDNNGAAHIGWLQLGDKWYYFRTTGVMHTGMLKKDGIYYYLEKSGVRHSGWLQVSGKLYYFKTNGQMLTGWLQVKGKKYYFKTNGEMLKGWLQVKGKKFYFKTNGQMHTGWLKLNGKYYYFKETGQMVTGRYKIGNKWYTFNSNGVRQ